MTYKNPEDQAWASKLHYEANKIKIKARTARRNKKQRRINKEYVAFVKSLSHCVDCGNDNDIVLEFDHVRGEKRGNVSDMSHQSFSIETIQLEIEKCEVRCANCHRIATYERRLDKKNTSQVIEKIQEELVSNQLSMSFG
tara:strand:+ start:1066 stop:1485 length:420 start_codon:yes stop_codon:yes gene_type:complete